MASLVLQLHVVNSAAIINKERLLFVDKAAAARSSLFTCNQYQYL
jgi:hypothetical protein